MQLPENDWMLMMMMMGLYKRVEVERAFKEGKLKHTLEVLWDLNLRAKLPKQLVS